MSSALSSQVVAVVATAVAISGTAILLAISMQKSGVAVSTSSFFHLVSSSNPKTSKSSKQLTSRSCFSNPDGKSKKKKKKVRFAEDVKDSVGNSEEYRRANHKRLLLIKTTTDDHTTKNCRGQSSSSGSCSTRGGAAAPENWAAVVDPCRLCSN